MSIVSSVFDPLGFIAPFIFKAKHLLQELCRDKLEWDASIPEQREKEWLTWLKELKTIEQFIINRCFKPKNFGQVQSAQLHHFSDASEDGYGTVSYLRLTNTRGKVHMAFLMAKARVAPLKQVTIPRKELTAAVLAVRMDRMLTIELQMSLEASVFWCDSTAVLKYIKNENRRFHTFVANRVSEIRDLSDVQQWRYINTRSNPADYASRGLDAASLVGFELWREGPAFLKQEEHDWPKETSLGEPISSEDPEVKKDKATVGAVVKEEGGTSALVHHYSNWNKLTKAVAWLLRLKQLLRELSRKRKDFRNLDNPGQDKGMSEFKAKHREPNISIEDIREAEVALATFCQRQEYKEDIDRLTKGLNVKKESHILPLDPRLDDGVLRVGGRLRRSSMPEEIKRPILMPKDHHVSRLLMENIHQQVGHSGRNYMLSQLRKRYWIPCANSLARKVISACVTCRRFQSALSTQKMADLPKDRVTPDLPPFTNVGVDYFGPMEVLRGRSHVKRYGVIFTCLTSRAVHLEVAHSLDTDSCINAFRRFISRRGQVQEVRSDNGTNFVATERELKQALKEWNLAGIENFFLQKGIRWIFNPPAGSHHGGVWERMIRSVKKILLAVTKQQVLSDESLATVMCEVEAILNSRPISTNPSDPNDLEALTPNHILQLKVQPVLPPGLFQKDDVYVRRRWKVVQYIANLFWTRWVKEYLPLLQERQRWTHTKRNLAVGDIVLVAEANAPRGSWLLGRVLEARADSKGHVRSVLLKTRSSTLERPISKVCLIVPTKTQ